VVAIDRVSLLDLLRKAGMDGDMDFLRESVEVLAQAVIELEASERIGAEKHERTPERTTHRYGYREWPWDTGVGPLRSDQHLPVPSANPQLTGKPCLVRDRLQSCDPAL